MKRRSSLVLLVVLSIPAVLPAQQSSLPKPQLGTREPGARSLDGFLVDGKPCIPLKRFAFESGYELSVSPSGKSVAIRVGRVMSLVYNGEILQIEGKESKIVPTPVALNRDYYVPLYVFESIYPVRFTYTESTGELSAKLPLRTLKMVIRKQPPKETATKPAPKGESPKK